MTIYLLKSIVAALFLACAFSAAISMLALMGPLEKKANPEKWRRFHRLAGYLFALLLLALSSLGISIVVRAGDSLPLRAIIHGFIGLFLLCVFFLKWLIARFYRQFLRMMPALGMTVFVLSIVMSSMAGYFFLRSATSAPFHFGAVSSAAASSAQNNSPDMDGSAERGSTLFAALCASCHFSDRIENKLGPGLKGLFEMPSLPQSGKPVTEANIREQFLRPALSMPSFAGLSEQEVADLMAYLRKI